MATLYRRLKLVLAEIAPKVLGFTNLMSALETAPVKLVLAVSSIIGVTGMPGNAWYAFANEPLSALVKAHGLRRPEPRRASAMARPVFARRLTEQLARNQPR